MNHHPHSLPLQLLREAVLGSSAGREEAAASHAAGWRRSLRGRNPWDFRGDFPGFSVPFKRSKGVCIDIVGVYIYIMEKPVVDI